MSRESELVLDSYIAKFSGLVVKEQAKPLKRVSRKTGGLVVKDAVIESLSMSRTEYIHEGQLMLVIYTR